MKLPVYPYTNISRIPADIDSVHLVRPIKQSMLLRLIEQVHPSEIHLSGSCLKRLSRKVKQLIRERGISLKISGKRGRAIEIDLHVLTEIIELHKDDQPLREIERLTKVPKSTIHYLIKYADRSKIKLNKQTVYLE